MKPQFPSIPTGAPKQESESAMLLRWLQANGGNEHWKTSLSTYLWKKGMSGATLFEGNEPRPFLYALTKTDAATLQPFYFESSHGGSSSHKWDVKKILEPNAEQPPQVRTFLEAHKRTRDLERAESQTEQEIWEAKVQRAQSTLELFGLTDHVPVGGKFWRDDTVGIGELTNAKPESANALEAQEDPEFIPAMCAIRAAQHEGYAPSEKDLARWEHREDYKKAMQKLRARYERIESDLYMANSEVYQEGIGITTGKVQSIFSTYIEKAEEVVRKYRDEHGIPQDTSEAPSMPSGELRQWIAEGRKNAGNFQDVLLPSPETQPLPPLPSPVIWGINPVTHEPQGCFPAILFGNISVAHDGRYSMEKRWAIRWFDSQAEAMEAQKEFSAEIRDCSDARGLYAEAMKDLPPFHEPFPEAFQPVKPSGEEILALAGNIPQPYRVNLSVKHWHQQDISPGRDSDGEWDYGQPEITWNARKDHDNVLEISADGFADLFGKADTTSKKTILETLGIDAQNITDITNELRRQENEHRKAWENEASTWAKTIIAKKAFLYLPTAFQTWCLALTGPREYRSGFDTFNVVRNKEEFMNAWPIAERLMELEMAGEIYANWNGPEHASDRNQARYVIRADGTLRNHPKNTGNWEIVDKDEIALFWSKDYAAGPHTFVAYPPMLAITPEQEATMRRLEQEIANTWDGKTGFASGRPSPTIGKGWDTQRLKTLSPEENLAIHQKTANPSPQPQPEPKTHDPYAVVRRTVRIEEPITPTIQPKVPTIAEVREQRERDAQAAIIAEQEARARILRDEQRRQAIQAELTPDVRKEIEIKFDELDAFFAIAMTIPPKNTETEKFAKEISQKYEQALGIGKRYQEGFLGKDALENIQWSIDGIKQFATRKKINEDIPKLWEKICGRVEQWRSIETLVNDEILKGGDIALLVEETIGGVHMTTSLLIKRIERRFLENPWGISVTDAILAETKELYSLL